jgi:hypothetical protein
LRRIEPNSRVDWHAGPDLDLEPEGGAFVDENTFIVNFQDNNGYAIFDVPNERYTYMGGYGYLPMTMDASDKDNKYELKSGWGASNTPAYGVHMPDQIAGVTVGGKTYILTANEGGSRDGEDSIGIAEADDGTEFEGEEARFGSIGDPPAATPCTDCADDAELGRVLSTPFQPSDFASNACGMNSCSAEELTYGLSTTFECVYRWADFGGHAGGSCDYADTDKILVGDVSVCPGWFDGPCELDATMASPQDCMARCAAESGCNFWTYEFEEGVHECFLKPGTYSDKTGGVTDAMCQEYVRYFQEYGDPAWVGYSGPKRCDWAKAPLTTTKGSAGTGSDGGIVSIGGRSFTIFE